MEEIAVVVGIGDAERRHGGADRQQLRERNGRRGAEILVQGVVLDRQREALGGRPQEADAPGALPQIARVVAGLAAVIFEMRTGVRRIPVDDAVEAASRLAETGNANRQVVRERNVERALHLAVIVIAVLAHEVAIVPAADHRVVGRHEHRAAGRVLADEGALRPAIHFDAFDVVIGLGGQITREGRHAVAVGHHARRRLRVVLALADAADVEVDALAQVVDRHVGRDELQRIDVEDVPVLQVVAAEHARRDRRRHQVLAPALCRHDHRLDRTARSAVG